MSTMTPDSPYRALIEQKIRAATCEGCAVNSPIYRVDISSYVYHRVTNACNGGRCTSKHAELLPIIAKRDRALIRRTLKVLGNKVILEDVGVGTDLRDFMERELDQIIEEVLRGGQQ